MSDSPLPGANAALAALGEPSWLAAVRATGLLGSVAAASWDQLTGLAARLLDAPMAFPGAPVGALCDALLDRLATDADEDDVALVAVRAHPEDRPRPAEAGPDRLPRGAT